MSRAIQTSATPKVIFYSRKHAAADTDLYLLIKLFVLRAFFVFIGFDSTRGTRKLNKVVLREVCLRKIVT